MPLPLPRIVPRSQKTGLVAAATGLSLLIAFVIFQTFYQRHQPVIQDINYTQLRALGDASVAASLSVEGELLSVTGRDGSISLTLTEFVVKACDLPWRLH